MLFFLGLAAWFDKHGTEVPDALTVPYAILGITGSVLSGRMDIALAAAFLLLMILLLVRIPGLTRLNDRVVQHAYKSEEAMENEQQHLIEEANAFYEKHGERVSRWLNVAYYVIPVLIAAAAIIDHVPSKDAFLSAIFSVGGIILLGRYYRACDNTDAESDSEEEEEELPLSALGGADMIVMIGMWGVYGTELFLLNVVIVCLSCLFFVFLKYCFTKKKVVGIALLPAIFLLAPIRLLLLLAIG